VTFKSMRAAPPSRRHLRHWEHVCRYLDAQHYWAVLLLLPAEPPMSIRLFKRNALVQLVRDRGACRRQCSSRWRAIVQRPWGRLLPDEPTSKVWYPSTGAACSCNALGRTAQTASGEMRWL
jgi:hypothetical protein